MREVDILLVKDGGPLKRCAMETLASSAVAILRGQRPLATQLIFDTATVTSSLPLGFKIFVLVVDTVRSSVLPFVFFPVGRRT